MTKANRPVLIELDEDKTESGQLDPASAPAVPELSGVVTGNAMQTAATLASRPPSVLGKWFWRLLLVLVTFGLSVWAWDFVNGLIDRHVYIGYAAAALVALFLFVCLGIAVRELAAFSRLKRLDSVHKAAEAAILSADLSDAKRVLGKLKVLYAGREDLKWGLERLHDLEAEVFDGDGLLQLAERELLLSLDKTARAEVETAARQVATVTAIVPLAFADVIVALTANLRMIRRIAEIYGGRAGVLGSWRLTRTVMTHLVATGAVAVGDDLISSIAGGGVLSKVSRRFGEGVVNGALTARVGVAAIEVCRPLPFIAAKRPSVTSLVSTALAGLFGAK